MATLTIRNLPDGLRDAIRIAAAHRGRSMEAEVRETLARVYGPARPGGARDPLEEARGLLRRNAGPGDLVGAFLARRDRDE